jgi:hypothetical protein
MPKKTQKNALPSRRNTKPLCVCGCGQPADPDVETFAGYAETCHPENVAGVEYDDQLYLQSLEEGD